MTMKIRVIQTSEMGVYNITDTKIT